MAAFTVRDFSKDSFHQSLSNNHIGKDEVAHSKQVNYLYDYLQFLNTNTIVVEHKYVDGGYLEDFASYYARCFTDYDKRCKRLHFFSSQLEEEDFTCLITAKLNKEEEEAIQESYCGFIVARPLPEKVIGRTVLRTYPDDGGRRQYRAICSHKANLFGTELTVRSLPYQEQDNVVAACATVSLWSAFQKTRDIFDSPAPRPAIITETANQVVYRFRPMPSHGLNLFQMAHAVRSVGLEPELFDVRPHTPLVSLIYAYLRFGLPVILTVEIGGELHAITLAGYSLQQDRTRDTETATSVSNLPLAMTGLRIDEFYAHDDQVGPFSRLVIKKAKNDYPVKFESDWSDLLCPRAVLVPVYDKIRITFLNLLQRWLTRLAPVVDLLFTDEGSERLEWDIQLTTINRYKSKLRSLNSTQIDVSSLLLMQQPRFIWQIELNYGGAKLMELLADGTDMHTSFPIYKIILHHANFRSEFSNLIHTNSLEPTLTKYLTPPLFTFLKEELPSSTS